MSSTKTVSMLDLRIHAKEILERVKAGQPVVLTYRGKPALRLEPIESRSVEPDDPFYRLAELSNRRGTSLSNSKIDEVVYGI